MNTKESPPFPSTSNDPFNNTHQTHEVEPSWESAPSSGIAPRWQLQTDQEKLEQIKVIQKLESKLKLLDKKKERPIPNYTNQIIPDASQNFSCSDSEEEENTHVQEEIEEGLPLLWKSLSVDPMDAPRKTEHQYNQRPWWFTCCFCC